MKDIATAALLLSLVYAVASINFAILVLRAKGLGDPRQARSGNAGTTNVARIAGRRVAALVLALDLARAASVEMVAARWGTVSAVPWAGVALLLGNRFPVWHGFRGGKGVAAYLGFVAALWPAGAAMAAAAWIVVYAWARVSAAASMAMVVCLGGAAYAAVPTAVAAVATTASLLLILHGHRPNWRSYRNRRSMRAEPQ